MSKKHRKNQSAGRILLTITEEQFNNILLGMRKKIIKAQCTACKILLEAGMMNEDIQTIIDEELNNINQFRFRTCEI